MRTENDLNQQPGTIQKVHYKIKHIYWWFGSRGWKLWKLWILFSEIGLFLYSQWFYKGIIFKPYLLYTHMYSSEDYVSYLNSCWITLHSTHIPLKLIQDYVLANMRTSIMSLTLTVGKLRQHLNLTKNPKCFTDWICSNWSLRLRCPQECLISCTWGMLRLQLRWHVFKHKLKICRSLLKWGTV